MPSAVGSSSILLYNQIILLVASAPEETKPARVSSALREVRAAEAGVPQRKKATAGNKKLKPGKRRANRKEAGKRKTKTGRKAKPKRKSVKNGNNKRKGKGRRRKIGRTQKSRQTSGVKCLTAAVKYMKVRFKGWSEVVVCWRDLRLC